MSEREKERERLRTEHRKQYLWIQSDRGEEGSRVPEMVRPLIKAADDWTDQAAERARVRKRERESGRRNALSRKSRRECGFIVRSPYGKGFGPEISLHFVSIKDLNNPKYRK